MSYLENMFLLEEQLEIATRLLFLLYAEEETERDLIDVEKFLEENSEEYAEYIALEDDIYGN